jgi:flagellar motility protein MotE (MotC chaperone)
MWKLEIFLEKFIKSIVFLLIFSSSLLAVDKQKLLDCYEIFEQKRAELEAEAEKILEQKEALESLKNTYMALIKKKEAKLKEKEKEINATLEKIEKKKKEIEDLIKKNKEILNAIKQAKMDKVTQSFAKMRPKNAASVLSNMKDEDALNILEKLPPKIVAKIFAKMDPNKAAKLTEMMQKVDTNESSSSP